MKLALHNLRTGHLADVRLLTDEEVAQHRIFTKVVSEARARLSLFKMLDRNYLEFRNYLDGLLSKNVSEEENSGEEIERLILNYLTFAYSIQQHFKVSIERRSRKDKSKIEDYQKYLAKLCNVCAPFAFVLDFRGYVQHVGLAVGRYHRQISDSSISISITTDPERLCRESKDWKRSGLKATDKPVDLISTLKEFHIQMLQSYGTYVAEAFFPELVPASDFYQSLTDEATKTDPEARMVLFIHEPELIQGSGGKLSGKFQLSLPPNALFPELGILRPKTAKKAKTSPAS